MKRNRLLISALCVGMAVAQMPVGVFAAVAECQEESEAVIYENQYLSDDKLSAFVTEDVIDRLSEDNSLYPDSVIRSEHEFIEETKVEQSDVESDAVDSDNADRPDFSQVSEDRVVKVFLTDVTAFGEDSNLYVLTNDESYAIYKATGNKLNINAGNMVAVIPSGSEEISVTVIPEDYQTERTYNVIAYVNNDNRQDISSKIITNPDGTYTIPISSGQTSVSILAEVTATKADIASLFAGGSGTADSPYLISNYTQLAAMNEVPLSNVYYQLTEDIMANDSQSSSSGSNIWTPVKAFRWHFDGNGKTISNLCIKAGEDGEAALFARGGTVAEIKDLTIENVTFCGETQKSAAFAIKASNISQCILKGKVPECNGTIAGLAFEMVPDQNNSILFSDNTNEADIASSSANCAGMVFTVAGGETAKVVCRNNTNNGDIITSGRWAIASGLFYQIGGNNTQNIVSDCTNNGDVEGCSATGVVWFLGYPAQDNGDSGRFNGVMDSCINNGKITATGTFYNYDSAHGILCTGIGNLKVCKCGNNGELVAPNTYASGILGSSSNNSTVIVDLCYNTGLISGSAASGIIGDTFKDTTVERCFNSGDLISTTTNEPENFLGGIAAYLNGGIIRNCFNSGLIDVSKATRENTLNYLTSGGVVGCAQAGLVENCYNVGEMKNENLAVFSVVAVGCNSDYTWVADSLSIKNCHYLKSGNLVAVGHWDGKKSPYFSARGLTGASMAKEESYKGWDFSNTWQIGANENYPYPEIIGNPYIGPKVSVDQNAGTDDPDTGNTDKPQPEPEKPVDVVTGGIYAVNQKFNVTAEGFLGQSYAKYEVSPKGAATVDAKKGLVTIKKVPADGKVTIYGLVKNGSKFKKEKGFAFTAEKPGLPKTITFTMPYDETINPDDNNARVLTTDLVKNTTLVPTTWISANPAVAEYDADKGMIFAKSKGSTKITAVFGDPDSPYSAKYPVTVKVNIPKINKTQANMQSGATLALKLSGAPKGSTVAWSVSEEDAEFVSVDASGKVRALKYKEGDEEGTDGKVIVKASIDGKEYACYECEVTVIKPVIAKAIPAMKAGKTAKITVKNTKYKAKEGGGITFESDNPEIATVDAKGSVKAVSIGECIIKVTVAGVDLECPVKVN